MATQYNGISTNIASSSARIISSSTNTNPIVVTANGHGLTTGDLVDITDHFVNTNANGVWQATVVDANRFSIPQVGNGVGGATGGVQPLSLGPTFQMPSPGDLRSAASVNTALQALGDRTAFLGASTGAYKLVQIATGGQNDDTFAIWKSLTTTSTSWTQVPFGPILVDGVVQGDVCEIAFNLTVDTSTPATVDGIIVTLAYAFQAPGAPASLANLLGSGRNLQGNTGANNLSLQATVTCLSGQTGQLALGLGHIAFVAASSTSIYKGNYNYVVRVWRPTNLRQ